MQLLCGFFVSAVVVLEQEWRSPCGLRHSLCVLAQHPYSRAGLRNHLAASRHNGYDPPTKRVSHLSRCIASASIQAS